MPNFHDILMASYESKKGIVVFFNGGSINGLVVLISDEGVVEMRSQQYSRIVIRRDTILAVAMA